MTEYLDHCESLVTKSSVLNFVCHYSPDDYDSKQDSTRSMYVPGFVKENDHTLIQKLFNQASLKMRMYGSPKELAENIKIFKNFPLNHRFLNAELEPYFTTPVIYENLEGDKKYISKPDMFVMLQSMFCRALTVHNPQIIWTTIAYFLKSHEPLGLIEFVPFDQKVLEEIWNEIKDIDNETERAVNEKKSFEQVVKRLKSITTPNAIFEALKASVPNQWNRDESERIKKVLVNFEEEFRARYPRDLLQGRAKLFIISKMIAEALEAVIKKRPEMFLTGKGPVTVRVFEDGDKKFVMKAELFNAIKRISGTEVPYQENEFMFDTLAMEQAQNQYGSEFKSIEFIRYPIQRAKHRAVPINGADPKDPDDFCILATDALLEFFKHLIQIRAFQTWNCVNMLHNVFAWLETYFLPNKTTPYFIRSKMLQVMLNDFQTLVPNNFPGRSRTIRDVKTNGFTVEDLKQELEYLEIDTNFMYIKQQADSAYAYVDEVKKEKYLRTCNMYDAVEICQLIEVIGRIPNLTTFLHNQGGCGRVPGIHCYYCNNKKKPEVVPEKSPEELKVGAGLRPPAMLEFEAPNSDGEGRMQEMWLKMLHDRGVCGRTRRCNICEGAVKATVPVAPPTPISTAQHLPESNQDLVPPPENQQKELDAENISKLKENKIASLESKLASQTEKSTNIESDLLKKTEENEKLQVDCIKLQEELSNCSEKLKVMESTRTELAEAHSKMTSLESKLAFQVDKSKQLESDLLKKTQENEELHVENIKLMEGVSEKNEEFEVISEQFKVTSVQLDEAYSKIDSLENEIKTEQKKSKKMEETNASPFSESDLKQLSIKKTQENEELHVANVRLQLENEMNKKCIEQLLDKVAKLSVVPSNN